jgi:hypothetical protein
MDKNVDYSGRYGIFILLSKSEWSCDISIDQEFWEVEKKNILIGEKRRKKPSTNQWSCDISIDQEF